jgi:FkbM family methyltransferase
MIQFLVKLPFFKRIIPSIGIRVLRFFKKNRGYFKIGGINFYLDFLDPIDRQIILNKKYEDDQVMFIEKEIKKNFFNNFLDIGANSGYYSFFFANKFKNLKVKAYEPNFDAFNKFKKTLNKNSFQNIEVFNFGLSDKEKKVKMYSLITHNYTHSNSTISKNLNDADIENYNIFEASLKIGDNQFNFYKKKLLMKIDVEGHEIEILKGLVKNLSNNNCLILIEISNEKFSEVNKYLVKNSFKQIFKSKYRSDYVYTNF